MGLSPDWPESGSSAGGDVLGVFICYCLMDPLANAMEQQARAEHSLLECVRTVLVAQAGGKPTLLAVDAGRKLLHLASNRPSPTSTRG